MSSVVEAAARRNAAVDVEANVKARHHNHWIWWQRIEVTMQYHHTQRAPFNPFLAFGVLIAFMSFFINEDTLRYLLILGGAVCVLLGLCFRELTVYDEGESLVIRFGPIPIFGRRLSYQDCDRVKRNRSTFWNGWGIHWNGFRRGWTWNLWGFDCVDVFSESRLRIRIGTDDPEGLETFLRERIGEVKCSVE